MIIKYSIERVYRISAKEFSITDFALGGIKLYEEKYRYVDGGFLGESIRCEQARDFLYDRFIESRKRQNTTSRASQLQNSGGSKSEIDGIIKESTIKDKYSID